MWIDNPWSRLGGEIFEREWKSRSTEISGKSIRCLPPLATWCPGIQRENIWRARSMQAVPPNFWLHIALKWSGPNNSYRERHHRFWGAVAEMSFKIRKCRGWVRQMRRVSIGGWASAWWNSAATRWRFTIQAFTRKPKRLNWREKAGRLKLPAWRSWLRIQNWGWPSLLSDWYKSYEKTADMLR